MSDGGVVTISADKILEMADKIRSVEDELRQLGLGGYGMQTAPRAPQIKKSSNAMEMEFDISDLDWQKANRDGGGPAAPHVGWAWCFAYPDANSPYPREECEKLVNAILQYGEIRSGKYLVKLAGRDFRLLNRRIAK